MLHSTLRSQGIEQKAAAIANDPRISPKLIADLRVGLESFVSDRAECARVAHKVIEVMRDSSAGIAHAREVVAPYRDSFWETFRVRSAGLVANITPAFKEIVSRVYNGEDVQCFDWGTGKGMFPGMLKKAIPELLMSGGDVIDYRAATDFPFYKIENNRVPELADSSQFGALICYVLHHEERPHEIVEEVSRILHPQGRAVVVELCPQDEMDSFEDLDRQRVLFSDLLYCVVWQDIDIPMPGTYKTPETWYTMFEQEGLILESDTRIQGTPLIYGDRHLMVFRKEIGDISTLKMPKISGKVLAFR